MEVEFLFENWAQVLQHYYPVTTKQGEDNEPQEQPLEQDSKAL
jgi:hypothetical protein